MKNKMLLSLGSFLLMMLLISGCKKSKPATPQAGTSNFWHGNILGSPSTFIGPGNAVLLRTDGTMREYANDYYSAGTTMGAADTASAKIKIEGTYYVSASGSVNTVIATWKSTSGTALTYTLTGTITGNAMAGTFASAGTGIGSSTTFSFTTP